MMDKCGVIIVAVGQGAAAEINASGFVKSKNK
jgi:hypothetical protein